jgi:hypothetical protein
MDLLTPTFLCRKCNRVQKVDYAKLDRYAHFCFRPSYLMIGLVAAGYVCAWLAIR